MPQEFGSRSLPAAADRRKQLPPVRFAPQRRTVGKPALGYNLLELILVMVIIGLVAAAGLKYYIDLQEEALRTGLESQARNFAGFVQVARADLLMQKRPDLIPTEPGRKLSVDLDGTRIYVNEFGWPANSSTELDSSSESQTAAECYELWFGMMSNPLPVSVEGLTSVGGNKGQQRYHISAYNAVCRYELVREPGVSYYFDYNLRSGKVLINIQKLDK
jgi:prepilin-type N-terminal cleavage/methylation domain-containing protein